MLFSSNRNATGPRYGHLSSLINSARLVGKRKTEDEETRRADGRVPPEGDNEPHAVDDSGSEASVKDEEEGDNADRPGGEARHANRSSEGDEDADRNGGDDDEDEDEDEDGDDDDDQDDEDETEVKKAKAAGFGKAIRAARRIERKRGDAIFTSKHAAGRIPMACELAFQNTLSAKKSVALLASTPKEAAANGLKSRMDASRQPRIGNDHPETTRRETAGQSLVAAAKRLTGGNDANDPVTGLAKAIADQLRG